MHAAASKRSQRWSQQNALHALRRPPSHGAPSGGTALSVLARGAGKRAHEGSRTPLEVLADFASTGDTADLDLWRESALALHGARQLTWSRGLRERYAGEPEKTDGEIVAGEPHEAEEEVALIRPDAWQVLLRANADVTWQLLDAAETGGVEAVEALIELTLAARRRRAA